MPADGHHDPHDFSREAAGRRNGLVAEFWDFLKHNKKWWLLPIILAFAVLLVLVYVVGSNPAALPFIYPLG